MTPTGNRRQRAEELRWRLQETAEARVERARAYLARDWSLVALARDFRGASALEPGGPSELFEAGNAMPVYPQLARLEVLDFAESTIWSRDERPPARRPQLQRTIAEAERLDAFASGSYDAVLASHVLEHLANPIGALREWRRVVRPGGRLVIVAPHLEGTFDHLRPITALAHLQQDADREIGEDDTTHLEEVLALHDLERDPGAANRETFERRTRDNTHTRAVHHHTFTSRSIAELLAHVELPLIALKPQLPYNIICVCRLGADTLTDDDLQKILARSPFGIDRADA